MREDGKWEPWILYILKGVEETAKQTLHLIEGIKRLMQDYKNRLRSELPKKKQNPCKLIPARVS